MAALAKKVPDPVLESGHTTSMGRHSLW